jgi:phosphonate transport system ATP-binding protein
VEHTDDSLALEARALGVTFGSKAVLRGVHLAIRPGEQLALVGPSGSGKTTLLRALCGALHPTVGEVAIDGRNPAALDQRQLRAVRRSIGFVHQHLGLVPLLRVNHNVALGRLGERSLLGGLRSVFASSRAEVHEIHRLLERVGIEEKLFERTDTLSGGQQQRVAIARALYQRPRILLADEPVASVDPARARAVIDLLTTLAREEGLTLVVSIHSLELARASFDRLVGLRAGEVVFDRPTTAVDTEDFDRLYQLDDAELLSDGA